MRNTAIGELCRLAETDGRVMLLTADLGYGVVDRFAERFPDRYVDVGISEQAMASMAAGLAREGRVPFLYSIGNFPTLRCLEQIRNDICADALPVKIIAVGSGFSYGQLGMSHHATEDMAALRALPNMSVFSPADRWEAAAAVRTALSDPGPCYLRLAKGGEPDLHPGPVEDICRPLPLREGSDLTILATGAIAAEALGAAELLAEKGVSAAVYSVPAVQPLDGTAVRRAARGKLLVTLEEHNVTGGFGGAVAELLSELPAHAPLLRLGLTGFTPGVGDRAWLRHACGIDAEGVAAAVLRRLSEREENT